MFPHSRTVTIRQLARTLLGRYGLHGWSLQFNRRKTQLGLCLSEARTIRLSLPFIALNGLDAA